MNLRLRKALIAPAIVAALAVLPASASAERSLTTTNVQCGATTLELLGINLSELLGNTCHPASSGLEIPLGGGNHVYLLQGLIDVIPGVTGGANSSASLLDLKLLSDELPVQLLRSSVYVTCRAGNPSVSGGSTLVGGLDAPLLNPLQLDMPLQLGSLIFVNEKVADATGLTARALRIATPAGDIVISQASGRYTENPCKRLRRHRR